MQYHQSESHHKELAACTDEQLCAKASAESNNEGL